MGQPRAFPGGIHAAGKLRLLDVAGCSLGDRGIHALFSTHSSETSEHVEQQLHSIAPPPPSLTELDLSRNSFALPGSLVLATVLRHLNPFASLSTIKLSGNPIGDQGVAALSSVLLESPRLPLTHLDVSAVGMGEPGAAALSKALAVFRSLCILNCDESSLGDAGAVSLGEALAVTPSPLRMLFVQDCGIGNKGGRALSECLRFCSSLEHLDADRNDLGRAAEVITTLLDRNKALKALVRSRLAAVMSGVEKQNNAWLDEVLGSEEWGGRCVAALHRYFVSITPSRQSLSVDLKDAVATRMQVVRFENLKKKYSRKSTK